MMTMSMTTMVTTMMKMRDQKDQSRENSIPETWALPPSLHDDLKANLRNCSISPLQAIVAAKWKNAVAAEACKSGWLFVCKRPEIISPIEPKWALESLSSWGGWLPFAALGRSGEGEVWCQTLGRSHCDDKFRFQVFFTVQKLLHSTEKNSRHFFFFSEMNEAAEKSPPVHF